MIEKIFKNKVYLTMIVATLISLICLISCFFIDTRGIFTAIFIVNICLNFAVSAIILLSNNNSTINFRSTILYLVVTLFMLLMDVLVISNNLDLSSYSNLMYIKNIELYLGLYSIYVLIMVLMGFYVIIKSNSVAKKNKVRQKVTKQ